MKCVIILPDGAADHPLPMLDGRTPLQAANIPNMDWIAENGRLGRVRTVPDRYTPGTDVATMSLFGYDPDVHFTGRAPIEAAARGLSAAPDQIIYRCNFVTIRDGKMADFTADHVDQFEADRLITDLNRAFADEPIIFHAGVSYRNLMIAANLSGDDLKCQPPHDIPNQPVDDHGPQGTGSDRLRQIMNRSAELFADHQVNRIRRKQNRPPVTQIWLWGQGRPTQLEPFAARFGLSGAVITAVDIIRGLAVLMGMNLIDVHGATGYIDTDYAAKGRAAVHALDAYDLVVTHVEAPDEAGHLGNAPEKVKSLERIDELIVGPLLDALRKHHEWRILVAPDHPTPCTTRAHDATPPPFCYAGSHLLPDQERPFSEPHAADAPLVTPGWHLMSQFLNPTA